jgi:hypothetical protein
VFGGLWVIGKEVEAENPSRFETGSPSAGSLRLRYLLYDIYYLLIHIYGMRIMLSCIIMRLAPLAVGNVAVAAAAAPPGPAGRPSC